MVSPSDGWTEVTGWETSGTGGRRGLFELGAGFDKASGRFTAGSGVVQGEQLVLLCGHYEGFDERIRGLADEEVSLGDFVLTGGELPAMTIINGVVRLLPGTVGTAASLVDESHSDLLLEHPHYTRPAEFRGMTVPDVLRSGDHGAIDAWRQAQREQRTRERRPDLHRRWQEKQQ